MRRKLLGTIAAVAAGAGAAWGQTPPPPMPVGPAGPVPADPALMPGLGGPMGAPGMMPGGPGMGMPGGPGMMMPGGPGMGMGMGGPGMGGPGMGMPGGVDPSSLPMGAGTGPYLPGGWGLNGQPQWQPPFTAKTTDALLGSRIAPKWWVDSEYLLYFTKAQPTQFPFVTTSAPAAGGQLGATSTAILHSNSDLGYNLFSGYRITAGLFCDDDRRFGVYASGFMTEHKANVFNASSDATGQPLLARPFVNATTGNADALLVSFPTAFSGNVTIYSSSQWYGAEGGPMFNLFRSNPDACAAGACQWNLNLLTGFRYLEVHEVLRQEQMTSNVNSSIPLYYDGKIYGFPATVDINDEINAHNRFYGGQVGLSGDVRRNRWSFGLTTKVALGVMHETVDVEGYSTLTTGTAQAPGTISVARSGLFANSSNIGRTKHDEFAVIPEVQTKLAYSWTSWLSTSIGYSFIYVSRVARPGDQYSVVVNPATIPTSASYGLGNPIATPNPLYTQSSTWLQGINFGVHVRY